MNSRRHGRRIMATSLRLLTSRSAVVALTLIAIAVVWIAAFQEVQFSRERELQEARKEAENYARAFEEHIARTIESVDAVVLTVIRELGRAGMPAVRRDLVRLHEIHQDIIAVVSVIDVRGDLIANSPPAPVINLADRPHFRAHVERDTGKPFLGKPLLGRVSQKWSMHLSRRVNAADGSFAGVVVASIDLDYLKHFYQSVSLGKDGVIELIGNDGIVRVRSGDEGITAGQDASGMKLFQDLRDGSRLGTYSAVSPIDQVRRIVRYRAVEGHPLVVTVNIAEKEVLDRVQPIARHYYLGAGGMTLLLAVMLALTDLMVNRQRRLGRELVESEQRLSLAQEGSEQALFDWNIVTGEVFLSERWNEMIGGDRTPVRTTFEELAKLVHPDDVDGQRVGIIEALKSDVPYRREHRVRTRRGEWIWIQSHGKVTARDARGRALRLVGYNADITPRKIAQLALAESEERFRATFENAPVGIMHTTIEDNRILQVNPKLCEMLGYTRDELLGLMTDEILHPDYRGTDRSKYRERMLNGELDSFSSERVFSRKDGSSLWVDRTVSLARDASGQPLYFIRMVEDITERKSAEEAVVRERALLRAIIDTVPANIYVKDAEGRFSLANKAWLKERNLSDKSIVGKTVFDIFPAELAEMAAAQDREVMRTGVPILDIEQRVVVKTPEGGRSQPRWLSVTKVPMVDASAKIIGTVGTSRDITERKLSAQRREMEHAIASVLADAITVEEALPRVIQTICEGLDWDCGFHWSWDKPSELLRCREHWYRPANGMDEFVQASLGTVNEAPVAVSSTPSGGLVRRVWVGATPVWLPDVASMPDFRRAPAAMRADLHGAFAFPIMMEGRPWGVMEFFSHEIRKPEEALLQIVLAIGRQVGQFIRRKDSEQALRESEEQFRQLAGNIPQVFWICDARQHRAVYISPAFQEITGLDPEKLMARAHGWLDAVHPDDRQQVIAARKEAASGNYDHTFRIVKPDGSMRWVRDRAFPVYDASGSVYRIAGVCEDITEKKAAEERLSQLAHFDILTGLPNRALYLDRMRQAMTLARRHDRATGVMFLDLDRFKVTNDTLGHSAGDQLLKQVGERLAACIREGDTVGRFGGDEFGIVLADMRSPDDARLVAQKILDVLQSPFELEGHEVFITASVGISLYPADSDDETELMKNADAAMYRAKESGRNRYEFYSSEMNARSLQRLNLESNLRRALERGEYLLHYQPKASLATREITGFEALLRWTAGGEKLVSPADFVPLLEDTGLIVPVGEWVIEAACRQLVTWREAGVQPVPIAINLSARQFRDKNLAATIERILRAHEVDPRLIEIELTESSLMVNTDEAVRTLSHLKSLGVRLSIDDFGTGYSSLAYLRRFPLDTLKIDRSFVNDVTTHADVANITRAVIDMSHNLGLKVVAEGVETEAQLAFLDAAGCGEMQGYYFSRPMPAADSLQWLREHRLLRSPVIALPKGKPRKQQR